VKARPYNGIHWSHEELVVSTSLRVPGIIWGLLAASWVVSGCAPVETKSGTAPVSLDDGVYLVIQETDVEAAGGATVKGQGVAELETVPLKDEPVETIRVSTPPVVRLRELRPRGAHFDQENACQLLTFQNDERLKAFSRGHIGSRVAMVIAGKVVTSHKIRAPLEADEVQISFCTEGGGDHLYKHLKELYASIPQKRLDAPARDDSATRANPKP
jgi:hypothetical protein